MPAAQEDSEPFLRSEALVTRHSVIRMVFLIGKFKFNLPKHSMYGVFTYIYHKNEPTCIGINSPYIEYLGLVLDFFWSKTSGKVAF